MNSCELFFFHHGANSFIQGADIEMSLFTVEQLELIRRLRMTGIAPDAVHEAFRALEQIEADLDAARLQSVALAALIAPAAKLFQFDDSTNSFENTSPILLQHLRSQAPVPVTINASSSSPVIVPSSSSSSPSPENFPSTRTISSVPTSSSPPLTSISPSLSTAILATNTAGSVLSGSIKINVNSLTTSSPSTIVAPHAPYSYGRFKFDNNSNSLSANSTINNNNNKSRIAKNTNNINSNTTILASQSSNCRPIRSQRTPMREITTLDDPNELDEFMQQGEEACIHDMKQFITQFSLRQTTVAMMTVLICEILEASFIADPSTRLETNGDGELIPQRRERYVFRPFLIRILEGFFARTPFPDLNRRIEIANTCNQALQIEKKGIGLKPKEVVSPQVVANWFANKRKDLRRRSNEEMSEANNANFFSHLVHNFVFRSFSKFSVFKSLFQVVYNSKSSSDGSPTPSQDGRNSNTPMEIERNDERLTSTSVPISVPALCPKNYSEAIARNLFQSLRSSTLNQNSTVERSMNALPDELMLLQSPVISANIQAATISGFDDENDDIGEYDDDDDDEEFANNDANCSLQSSRAQVARETNTSLRDQCVGEVPIQMDIDENSVLKLVNAFTSKIRNPVIKMEQAAE